MKKEKIIRAWRDRDAYLALTDEERAQLPDHPAGIVELSDEDVADVAGGAAGTHYSHCDPTADWCDDCGSKEVLSFR